MPDRRDVVPAAPRGACPWLRAASWSSSTEIPSSGPATPSGSSWTFTRTCLPRSATGRKVVSSRSERRPGRRGSRAAPRRGPGGRRAGSFGATIRSAGAPGSSGARTIASRTSSGSSPASTISRSLPRVDAGRDRAVAEVRAVGDRSARDVEAAEVVEGRADLGRVPAEAQDVERRDDPHPCRGRLDHLVGEPGPRRVRELVDARAQRSLDLPVALRVRGHRQVGRVRRVADRGELGVRRRRPGLGVQRHLDRGRAEPGASSSHGRRRILDRRELPTGSGGRPRVSGRDTRPAR